eukprot:c19337_g1_i2 orf=302-1516(+)
MVEEAMNRGCPSFDGVKKMEGQYDTAVFTLEGHPGFYFIPNALNVDEQMYWIQESLLMFPQPPNRTNHTAFYGHINGLWDKAQNQEVFAYAGILDNESKDVSWSFTGSDQGHNSCDNFVDKQSASQRTVKILQDTSTLSSSGTVNRCQGDTLSTSVSTRAVDTAVHVDQTVRSEEKTCNKDVDEGFKFSSVQIPLFRSGKTSGVDKSCCEFVSNKYPVMERSCSGEFTKTISAKSLLRKLRWATLGLQFDWSKRAYDLSLPYTRLSSKLSELASRLAKPALTCGSFCAEAAIINYFGPDDMLGGHVDDMELDWTKPIVSISLGCKALFLLGGQSRDDPPTAMFLRSGDVLLMAGPARSCFHGVPRIFVQPEESELPGFSESNSFAPFFDYIKESRININIRQVH